MAKKSNGYLGLGWLISVILAIFPLTNIILGVVIRAQHKNILGVVLNIILFPIFYVVDLICIIISKKIFILV